MIKRNTTEDLAGLREDLAELRDEVGRLRLDIDQLVRVTKETSTVLVERIMDSEAVNELTKQAWMRSRPTPELTWNAEMDGSEFIGHVRKQVGEDLGRVLEIGPGYGRLLETILREDVRFSDYLGLDISAETVAFLSAKFGNERITYENADFFTFDPPGPYDTILSSAVFMHFYPSVEPALRRCHQLLKPGGQLCFDVPIGDARYLDVASQFYVRDYRQPEEIVAFAKDAGYSQCTVEAEPGFAPGIYGWFVCATK